MVMGQNVWANSNIEGGYDGHSNENIGNAFFKQKNRSPSRLTNEKSSLFDWVDCTVGQYGCLQNLSEDFFIRAAKFATGLIAI